MLVECHCGEGFLWVIVCGIRGEGMEGEGMEGEGVEG